MDARRLTVNGQRFLVVNGINGPRVYVRVRDKWSGGSVSPAERDAVLDLATRLDQGTV